MITRHVLLWARTAPLGHRVDAASALARAWLESELAPEDRQEAELALLAMLDDPAPEVRRAMAEELGSADSAPRTVITALLQDESEVAAVILAESPLLGDAELIDQAALSDERGQEAIAGRPAVSPAVAGALAEVGSAGAVLALLRNRGASVAEVSLARIVERFGHGPEIRELLLARPDLPVEMRLSLATALARSRVEGTKACDEPRAERIARAARDTHERAVIGIVQDAPPGLTARIVSHLRRSGELTLSLLLRAALGRQAAFVESALSDLSGLPVGRVASHLRHGGSGAKALCRKAGLPKGVVPVFLAVVADHRETREEGAAEQSRRLLDRALTAGAEAGSEPVLAFLQRYEAEIAREAARALARSVAEEAAILDLTEDEIRVPEPAAGAADEEDVAAGAPEEAIETEAA